jgi:hypothetical protein
MAKALDDKTKLRMILAFSRDFLLVSLEEEILKKIVEDPKVRAQFIEYRKDLIERVENDMKTTLEAIERGDNQTGLEKEGLTGNELKFKYAFFNSVIEEVNNVILGPVLGTDIRLPTPDKYQESNITGVDDARYKDIRKVLISDSLWKRFTGGVKKVGGKVVQVVFSGINKYWESVNAAMPYLGAVKEIKGILELAIDVGDTVTDFKNNK